MPLSESAYGFGLMLRFYFFVGGDRGTGSSLSFQSGLILDTYLHPGLLVLAYAIPAGEVPRLLVEQLYGLSAASFSRDLPIEEALASDAHNSRCVSSLVHVVFRSHII